MNRNTIICILIFCISCILTLTSKAQSTSTIYTINLSDLSDDEVFAVLTLQGLANREKPQIYVEPKHKGAFQGGGYLVKDINVQRDGILALADEVKQKYPNLEDVFEDYYHNKYGYNFQPISFIDLFAKFSDYYKGIVIYGGKKSPEGIAITTTSCAQLDAIPVTIGLKDKYSFFQSSKILENLITHSFSSRTDAHRWAIDTYLSKCSKEYAYSYWDVENNFYTVDYAIKNKLFSFDLSFANEKIHTDNGINYPFSLEEAKLFDEICAYLNPGSIILGWGKPNEYIIQARCGERGHALICTNSSPNSTIHQTIPAKNEARKQIRQFNDNDFILENKIYITFSINEGDTYKSIGNLMNDGGWLHQKRGKIPFNWPINPKVLDMFPALAEYYYTTMTQNDYFYVPTSGIGYFDATFSTPEQRNLYAQNAKKVIENMDMHYIDVWWNNFADEDKWIASMGVKGCTRNTGREAVNFSKAIPIIESDMYYDLYMPPTKRKASNMAFYIKEQSKSAVSGNRPWFINVYAADPAFASAVMENLDPEKYKVVCMDEFFILANKAKSKLALRSVPKNNTLIKQLIMETEAERFMEEFDKQSNWVNYFCNYTIENGKCTIYGAGNMYYTQLIQENNKFNLDKYPYFAARITNFPADKNVNWLIKLGDGNTTKLLKGEEKYAYSSENIYLWNIPEITGWKGIKATNLQLVMEGSSDSQMKGLTMEYDWLHTYENIEQMEKELNLGSVNNITSSNNIRIITTKNLINIISESQINSIELITLQGSLIARSNHSQLSIKNIIPGIYVIRINDNITRKISIN